jgi:hypothetical protein
LLIHVRLQSEHRKKHHCHVSESRRSRRVHRCGDCLERLARLRRR